MKAKKIPFRDITIRTDLHTDAGGVGFEWECPDCMETVLYAPDGWDTAKCSCGTWDMDITAQLDND